MIYFAVLKILSKHIALIVVFSFGFLLTKNSCYACSSKTGKSHLSVCSKTNHLSAQQSCQKGKHHHDCNHKCKHCSCVCSRSTCSIYLQSLIGIKSKNSLAVLKKEKFDFIQVHYPSGFHTIWLPPKIS